MLFHSKEFILVFLPIVLICFYLIGRSHKRLAYGWVAVASLVFYAYWSIIYLPLICASIVVNYAVGIYIITSSEGAGEVNGLLVRNLAIMANLILLVYFKYLMFAAHQLNWLFGLEFTITNIVLPIGISFYTFTQIAFLIDASRGNVQEKSFVSYVLFVTYFPHLIAGPILHHNEMMPQFADKRNLSISPDNLAAGIALFGFGLFKKLIFADNLATLVGPVFDASAEGVLPVDAWCAALAYTLQIYFDFSGYSDMAVGISLMFNIGLPVNFYSPYKATSIIEFWRRWHMTLSRFLRDYLYFGLGGNRKGRLRRYLNLMITMLLGGLWHGANWTFVAWGGHGLFLCCNHAWRTATREIEITPIFARSVIKAISVMLTFLAVTVSWVFFRASDVTGGVHILGAMVELPGNLTWGKLSPEDAVWLSVPLAWVFFMPNSNEVMNYRFGSEVLLRRIPDIFSWRPEVGWGVIVGGTLFLAAAASLTSHEKLEFLYFQF